MDIIIEKRGNRNLLTCIRADGSYTTANLGPNIPNHDLAHFVVETKLSMQAGFFGSIRSGKSVAELSDKEIIKSLPPEAWIAEIMARNLQGLRSGAATVEDYAVLVENEIQHLDITINMDTSNQVVAEMLAEYDSLCAAWDEVPPGGELSMRFQ